MNIKDIFTLLNKELEETGDERLEICDYSGGNDSGGIHDYNKELFEKLGIKNDWEVLDTLHNYILSPQYYSYAFDGDCNGTIYYEKDKFIVEGQESYTEYKDKEFTLSLEDLENV